MKKEKRPKIMFSGGGTGGSVTPLLAVAEEYLSKYPETELIFVGTKKGPEQKMVAAWSDKIRFIQIISGKWRRYLSWRNILDLFKIKFAFYQSLYILMKEKPDVMISAGSFVSVPLAWAAWFLRIPLLIHQQDVRPGLANRLMAPIAKVITVTFEKSVKDYGAKARWIGNPVIEFKKIDTELIRGKYDLKEDRKTVFVIGGGTGAVGINNLIVAGIDEMLPGKQVVHLTGDNKQSGGDREYYITKNFLSHNEVLALMSMADIIISRCGIGVLTELSHLHKPAILIPMPASHQEDNAAIFKEKKAALVLDQRELTGQSLANYVNKILGDKDLLIKLSANISQMNKQGASKKMAELIKGLIK